MDKVCKNLSLIDLTHPLSPHVPSWSGGCGFTHTLRDDYDLNAPFKFRTYDITMQAGIGTHMDAPAHCIPGGKYITDLDLNEFLAPCIVINISSQAHERYSLSVHDIDVFETQHGTISPGCFVMVQTGWDQYWNEPTKYWNNQVFPTVSKAAAEVLLDRQIVGLGIDTLSPDRPEGGFHVHNLILGAGKYIIENVANAEKMPPIGAFTLALPMKIKGGTEAPIRLIGIIRK